MACLQEFQHVNNNLKNAKRSSVLALHKFVYENDGDRGNRQRLRTFSGFNFSQDDQQFIQKREYARRCLSAADLVSICVLLGLEYSGADVLLFIFENLRAQQLLKDVGETESGEEDDDVAESENADASQQDDVEEIVNELDNCSAVSVADYRVPQRGNNSSRFSLNFRDVEDTVRKFDASGSISVEAWIAEFEEMSAMMQWDQLQMFVFAKQSLKGLAKLFVSGEKGLNSWFKLRAGLLDEFSHKVNSAQVHRLLSDRQIGKDEGVFEYFYSMKGIAAQGVIEEDALMQYVIDGIKDLHTNKAMLYGARTMKDFKEKLGVYEKFAKKHKSYNNRPEKQMVPPINKEVKKESSNCYNCGDKGHISVNCPSKSKGTKCFRCNEFGHIANKCPLKLKNACLLSINDNRYHTEILIEGCKMVAVVDTGSQLSLIRKDEYIKIGAPTLRDKKIIFRGVGLEPSETIGEFTTEVSVNDVAANITVHVVDQAILKHSVILGTNFIDQVDLRISQGVMNFSKAENKNEYDEIPFIYKIEVYDDEGANDLSYIKNVDARVKVTGMIQQYNPEKTKDLAIQTKIILKSDVPVVSRPRRLSPWEKEEVNSQMNLWLDNGIIRPSDSEYASPIVLVKKKNGTTRICVDYRAINRIIERPHFPLPLIEDQLDALQGGRVFSLIDLKNGFFHVPIAKGSEKYTAFVTPNGHYEFMKTPFGLAISPTIFQKFINAVFKDLIDQKIIVAYMDDLIILAKDEDEAIKRLKITLDEAAQHALQINWTKCRFLQAEIEYLGHVISNGMIKPSKDKTQAVMKFPKPTNVKKVQSFLGLTGYFRKFIPQYSLVARPLTNLLKNDVIFEFNDRELEAFVALKQALVTRPVLRLYKLGAETELHTDACKFGYGMILMQKDDEDQKFHPVYYASGKTTPAEENYSSYELEVLAIVKALKKFRVYLLGIRFKIITDCQAFSMTMRKKDLNVRVARWVLLLEEFSYEVCHRPGNNMKHVDALSRNPIPYVLLIVEGEDGMLLRMKKAQDRDENLVKLKTQSQNNETQQYSIKNGILYRNNNYDWLIVVPTEMQTQVVRRAHEKGHFGVSKTEELVKQDFWFENLRQKVEGVVRTCLSCILAERKQGKQEGFLNPITKGEYPLDTYHLDHLGPMTLTKKKYQHVLVIVDAFTKFVWLFPTKSTDAAAVVESLKKLSVTFGNPRRIISDRGPAFTSGLFKEYLEEEKIEQVLITTGVPRSNGQVERINRTLIPILAKLAAPSPESWYKYVDLAQRWLNNTVSRTTGKAPFQLMFGVNMRIKDDIRVRELLEQEWVQLFDEERNELREHAQQRICIMQEANRTSYNKNRKGAKKYEKGELVAIKRTQFGPGLKLHGKYIGPYEVVHVMRNDRYTVEKKSQTEGPRHTTTTADFMKPWLADQSHI